MQFLLVAQILVAILLSGAILLQSKGSGLSSAIGGGASYHTRRGMEKSLFYLTIILAVIFTAISLIALV